MFSDSLTVEMEKPVSPARVVAGLYCMLAGLAAAAAGLLAMAVLPTGSALATACLVMAAAAAWQLRHGIVDSLVLAALGALACLSMAFIAGVSRPWIADHAVAFVLTAAAVTGAGISALSGPLTRAYARGVEMTDLHRFNSAVWLVALGLGAVLAWMVPGGAETVVVAAAAITAGALVCGVAGFVWFGSKGRRKTSFTFGGLVFSQAPPTVKTKSRFYDVVADEIWDVLSRQSEPQPEGVNRESVMAALQALGRPHDPTAHYIFAWDGDTVAGVVCVILDRPGTGLTPESMGNGMSLDGLRKKGRVAEIAYIAVDQRYRAHLDTFTGLLLAAVDIAYEHDIRYLVIESFIDLVRLYRKLGFTSLTRRPYKTSVDDIGFEAWLQPMVMNLPAFMFHRYDRPLVSGVLLPHFNPYLLERYLKRLVAQHALARLGSPNRQPIWDLDGEDLRKLVDGPGQADKHAEDMAGA